MCQVRVVLFLNHRRFRSCSSEADVMLNIFSSAAAKFAVQVINKSHVGGPLSELKELKPQSLDTNVHCVYKLTRLALGLGGRIHQGSETRER